MLLAHLLRLTMIMADQNPPHRWARRFVKLYDRYRKASDSTQQDMSTMPRFLVDPQNRTERESALVEKASQSDAQKRYVPPSPSLAAEKASDRSISTAKVTQTEHGNLISDDGHTTDVPVMGPIPTLANKNQFASSEAQGKNMNYDEVLHQACIDGNEEVLRALLENGYDVNCRDEKTGDTPLLTASSYRHEHLIEFLLKKGASPRAKDSRGDTTLHRITRTPRIPPPQLTNSCIDLLFQHRPPLDVRNSDSDTPLMLAAYEGETELVRQLIEHGADVSARSSNGLTPLHKAAIEGKSLEVFELLIKSGVPVNARNSLSAGFMPLHTLAMFCSSSVLPNIIDQFLQAGADVEAMTAAPGSIPYKGVTPLGIAAFCGNEGCVTHLVKSGANIEARNSLGRTPLHLAAYAGRTSTVKLLLDLGASIEARDQDGETALHQATYQGNLSTVEVLLDHGANPFAKTKRTGLLSGETPRDLYMPLVQKAMKTKIKSVLKEAEMTWEKKGKK